MTSKVSQAAVVKTEGVGTQTATLPDAGTPEFHQLVLQLQTAAQQQAQQQQAQQAQPQRRVQYEGKSVDDLRMLADILDDVQDQLEPVRDKVLDEKARLTGYAQCAEAFLKIIVGRSAGIKKRAVEQARTEREVAAKAKQEQETAAKPKPKSASKKKPVKEEAKPGGHDSVEKRRGSP